MQTTGMDIVRGPFMVWVGSLLIDYYCDDTTIMLTQYSSDHDAARWHHISAKQYYNTDFTS